MDKFLKFFPLVKVDEAQRIVYGLVTAEIEDKDGETCHYDSTKPQYKAVNDELGKASGGENIMPLREMHQLNAVGAGKSIDFDDERKQIKMAFKVVDDSSWKKVLEHVLLGFSQGGRYLKQWTENGIKYYTAQPGEVSLVDNPCLPGAFIEIAKADGTVELYKTKGPSDLSAEDLQKLIDGLSASLGTRLEKSISEKVKPSEHTATGETDMTPEQIKKCAAALGISEAEFTKQFIEGGALAKKHGIAALHSHMETAMAHHDEMMKAHHAMGKMHEKHAGHLEKCMKACKSVMGSEEGESEKAFKALLDELKAAADPESTEAKAAREAAEKAAKANAGGGITAEQMNKAIEDAVKKALDGLPKPQDDKTPRLFAVPRFTEDEMKKVQSGSADEVPVNPYGTAASA